MISGFVVGAGVGAGIGFAKRRWASRPNGSFWLPLECSPEEEYAVPASQAVDSAGVLAARKAIQTWKNQVKLAAAQKKLRALEAETGYTMPMGS